MSGPEGARRRVTGWGFEGAEADAAEVARLAGLLQTRFPGAPVAYREPVDPSAVPLPAPRLAPPRALAELCTSEHLTRCLHALGRSYADAVRAQHGAFAPAPDVVAMPRAAGEVARVLDWCAASGAVVIPFGGGTSVVGGVNPPPGDRPVVCLQLRGLDRVLEVDRVSRAARIQAGATGPALEQQLRPAGLSMRFFPQSFELSTLGGWIATRAGGHFATGPTHVDDLVEAVTAVTPAGLWEARRVPASGAGPSPDRLLLGSEGALGVVTEAWVRLQPRPRFRASAAVRFDTFAAGLDAVRAITQAGLRPAGCRLLDPLEALLNGAGDGSHAVLLVGLESAHAPLEAEGAVVLEVCRDSGGEGPERVTLREEDAGADGDEAAAWRAAFLRAPYQRDALIALGMIAETFDTAVTWDRAAALHADVTAAVEAALAETCGDGIVTCRTTHAYPDGVAPYFTVIAPGRRGAEVAQWAELKAAASDAVLAAGGTITHHHAVGRDHRAWYDRERPGPFAAALRAAKAAVDPHGILNPGVLLDPAGTRASPH